MDWRRDNPNQRTFGYQGNTMCISKNVDLVLAIHEKVKNNFKINTEPLLSFLNNTNKRK